MSNSLNFVNSKNFLQFTPTQVGILNYQHICLHTQTVIVPTTLTNNNNKHCCLPDKATRSLTNSLEIDQVEEGLITKLS